MENTHYYLKYSIITNLPKGTAKKQLISTFKAMAKSAFYKGAFLCI
jgi:hypothetical protein